MTASATAELEKFYGLVSANNGIDIKYFQNKLDNLLKVKRLKGEYNSFILSKLPWKKLADEIVPVARFFRIQNITAGRVRFPLDDQLPDCWLWKQNSSEPTGIEVTIAQGTERFYLKSELIEKGIGRGFLGLQDDASRKAFKRAIAREQRAYYDEAGNSVRDGIIRCMTHKSNSEFAGMILLIEANLRILDDRIWQPIMANLKIEAIRIPFSEVHILASDGHHSNFRVK